LKLLRIHFEAEQHISAPKPALTGKTIGSRIEQGQPLVTFDELDLDWTLLRGIGEGVIVLFAGYPELFGEIPEGLRKSGADHYWTEFGRCLSVILLLQNSGVFTPAKILNCFKPQNAGDAGAKAKQ